MFFCRQVLRRSSTRNVYKGPFTAADPVTLGSVLRHFCTLLTSDCTLIVKLMRISHSEDQTYKVSSVVFCSLPSGAPRRVWTQRGPFDPHTHIHTQYAEKHIHTQYAEEHIHTQYAEELMMNTTHTHK